VIRVLLDIPSPALRAGLRALLSSDRTIKVLASPDSLDDNSTADVTITSAVRASLSRLEADPISAGTLFLSDGPLNFQEMRRSSRAWGILPMDASAEELTAAIHALSQGLVVGEPALLFEVDEPAESGPLTERENEVLGLLARGMSNKQIAAMLGISEHTVKFHVSSIYTKLNVTNRAEAVREGLRGGWIAL
jgi:DNA-binding CsgD family transcriptional regulator